MTDDLLSYIREHEAQCRERANLCQDTEHYVQWLQRAVEWAAIRREVELQIQTRSKVALLMPFPSETQGA